MPLLAWSAVTTHVLTYGHPAYCCFFTACSGAGNFRRMAGPPVYGVAMCTVHGIRNVLRAVADAQLRDKPKVC